MTLKQNFDSSAISFPPKIGPYIFKETIGEGSFSIVKLVYHETLKEYYACKIVPRALILDQNSEERFEVEIRINQQLHHSGIVQIIDLLKNEQNYFVIMEYCPNGELFRFIVEHHGLNEDEAAKIMIQILKALQFVHLHAIAHRDLKPENLLLDKNFRIKISDFGLSKIVGVRGLCSTPCGSPCYASPECLAGGSYDGRRSDLWSCGVILYAMVTGQLPWTKRNRNQLYQQIMRGEYKIPQNLSPACRSLISGFMTVDPCKRLSIEEALLSPFFSGANVQDYDDITNMRFLSIKRVDAFFSHDDAEIPHHIALRRDNSTSNKDFFTITREIKTKEKSPVIRSKTVFSQPNYLPSVPKPISKSPIKPKSSPSKISNSAILKTKSPGLPAGTVHGTIGSSKVPKVHINY